MISVGKDRCAKLWEVATGKEVRTFDAKPLHTYEGGQQVDFGGVRALAISPDGKSLLIPDMAGGKLAVLPMPSSATRSPGCTPATDLRSPTSPSRFGRERGGDRTRRSAMDERRARNFA